MTISPPHLVGAGGIAMAWWRAKVSAVVTPQPSEDPNEEVAMRAQKIELRKIASLSAALTLLVVFISAIVRGSPLAEAFSAAINSTIALSAVGVFWGIYNKFLWRMKPFRLWGWLSPVPDLSGRWVGTVQRDVDDVPHQFVLEVVQTFTAISFRTFSASSAGESVAVSIVRSDDSDIFGVHASWRTTTSSLTDPTRKETFLGASQWRLEYIDKPGRASDKIKIMDRYHTDRKTTGSIELKWAGSDLCNGFAGPGVSS